MDIDLYPTLNIKDLTRQLASAVMKKLPVRKSSGRKFLNFIRGFRPVITYDPLTRAPEVRFEYSATVGRIYSEIFFKYSSKHKGGI